MELSWKMSVLLKHKSKADSLTFVRRCIIVHTSTILLVFHLVFCLLQLRREKQHLESELERAERESATYVTEVREVSLQIPSNVMAVHLYMWSFLENELFCPSLSCSQCVFGFWGFCLRFDVFVTSFYSVCLRPMMSTHNRQ